MPHDEERERVDDRMRFEHMLEACRDATSYVEGRTRADLDSDSMLFRAIVHCVQVIGEAAARTSDGARDRAPDVPWKQIVGMRHILVHVYHDIDADAVWKVATEEIPPFAERLERAIEAWPQV